MALTVLDIARNIFYLLPFLAYPFPALRLPATALCYRIAVHHLLPGDIAAAIIAIDAVCITSMYIAQAIQGGRMMDRIVFPR